MRQFGTVSLSLMAGVAAAAGWKMLSAQEQHDAVFRADTRLVAIYATVVDNKDRLVTNLGQDAFRVYENNVAQSLKVFRREDVPVSLGLILDNSGSMRDKRERVAAAALELVKASNPEDEAFIVNFNDDLTLTVPFTSDVKKMQEGLAAIDSRGGTRLRDAVLASLDELKHKAKRDKKVLLVVTDGEDMGSSPSNTMEKLLAEAQRAEVLIYAIGLLDEQERGAARRAQRTLRELANASGGMSYFPKAVDDIHQLALEVAHEIRNQYVLAYTPSIQALDGSYRKIKVVVKGPNKPQARTRPGYYATPDSEPPREPGGVLSAPKP